MVLSAVDATICADPTQGRAPKEEKRKLPDPNSGIKSGNSPFKAPKKVREEPVSLTLGDLATIQNTKTLQISGNKLPLLLYINAFCKKLSEDAGRVWDPKSAVTLPMIERAKTINKLYWAIKDQVIESAGRAVQNSEDPFPTKWHEAFDPSWEVMMAGEQDPTSKNYGDLKFRHADNITVGELYWLIAIIRGYQTFHCYYE